MKHTFRKCLSIVLALATLFSVCVLPLTAAPEASDPKCDHYKYITEADFVRTQVAECDNFGGDVYHCPECNENFVHKDTWVDALGHDFQPNYEHESSVAPTGYDKPGTLRWDCSRCDEYEMRDWWKGCKDNNHSVVKGDEAPDCTKTTTRTDTCKLCDWTETVEVAPLGHKWNNGEITQTPICGVRDAIVTFTCTREGCDDGVDAAPAIYTVTEIAPINHKWKWYDYDAGECGRNGNQAAYKCEYCDWWSYTGEPGTEEDLVIYKPAHNWVVCTDTTHAHEGTAFDGCHAGVVYLYCTNTDCGICYADERVPTQEYAVGQSGNHVLVKRPDGSIYSAGMTRTAATQCMKYATYSCACGYIVTSEFVEDQKQHNWIWPDHKGEIPPTCFTYGYKSCYDCGATEGYADINGNPIPGNEKYNKLNHIPTTYYGIMPEVGSEAFVALMKNLGADYHEANCAGAAYYEWNCPHANCKYATVANGGTGETYKYYVGDPTAHNIITVPAVAPTCTETGVVGGKYCSLCNIKSGILVTEAEARQVINALGHTWETSTVVKDPAQGEQKTDTDSYWGKVAANCSYAAHEGVLCGRCNLEQRNGPKRNFDVNDPANGKHVYVPGYSEELVTPATCTTPALLRYYCYICNAEEETALNPGEKVGHDWQLDPTIKPVLRVPATCQNEGYDVYFCQKCNVLSVGAKIPFTYEDHDRFISHFKFTGDPSQDVSASYDQTIEAWVFTLTPQGHDAIKDTEFANVSLVYDAKTETFQVLLLNGVALKDIINAPEASADGKSTGYIGFDDPNTPELDGYDEVNNLGVCGIYSYYEWNCDLCGYRYNKHIEDQYGLTGDHVEIPVVDEMDCATAHIGKSGATECARCGNGLKAGVEVPVKHTIDKTAAGYIGKTTADCLNPGWEEYGVCTVCTQFVADHNGDVTGLVGDYTVDANGNVFRYNGYVEALGHQVGTAVEAQKVNCIQPGWDAHIKCVRCDYVVDNATIDTTATTDEAKYANIVWVAEMTAANGINNYKDPTGHNFTKNPALVPMQCMKDGYIWYDCANENCSAVSVVNYKYGWAEHRYSDKSNVTEVECQESYCLCQNEIEIKFVLKTGVATDKAFYVLADYDIETATCNYKNVLREAGDHMNAATDTKESEVIDLSDCLNYDMIEDHKCIYCEVTFEIKDYDHHDCESNKRVAANCQNYAYTLWACTRCTYTWITDKGNTFGDHDYTVPLEDKYQAPTWTTDGFRKMKCYYCSDVQEQVLAAPDLFFEMGIENKFGGSYYVNGSFMAVTIYMTGSTTDVHGIKISIPVDSFDGKQVLEFAGVANNTVVIDNKNLLIEANGTEDSVELYIHVENAKDGVLQNVTVTEKVALTTLYFQINPEYYDVDVKNTIFESGKIAFGDVTVNKFVAEEKDPLKQVVAVEDIILDTNAPDARDYLPEVKGVPYSFRVYKLGDMNLDGRVLPEEGYDYKDVVIVEDLYQEWAVATEAERKALYDARADIDKDGDIDMLDFAYMKQLAVKYVDYIDLAAMVATVAD